MYYETTVVIIYIDKKYRNVYKSYNIFITNIQIHNHYRNYYNIFKKTVSLNIEMVNHLY